MTHRRDPESFRVAYGPWALVTGASDGIGRATAYGLAAAGLNVVMVARRRDVLNAIALDLQTRHGVQARVIGADLADDSGATLVETATEDIDIGLAVLAAGHGALADFIDDECERQLDMIAVNVAAVTRLAHHFARRLRTRSHGGIVLFGSIVGWQGVPGQATYAATKAYVQSFGEALHWELRSRGVDVLCVAPGPVRSAFGVRAGMRMQSTDSPAAVANGIIKTLGVRLTVVPGARGKLLTSTLRSLPRTWRTRVLARVVAGMRPNSGEAEPPQRAQPRDGAPCGEHRDPEPINR